MSFKDKVKLFLEISCIGKTEFCKRANISLTTLCQWLSGNRCASDTIQQKMADFMANYVKALVELSNG